MNEYLVKETDIIFVTVGTPSKTNGEPDLSYIEAVAKEIAPYIRKNHVIVIKSTAPPEAYFKLRDIIIKERRRLLLPKVDFYITVNPEFLREGHALDDFLHPKRIVIGAESEYAKEKLIELYSALGAPIIVTDPVSAIFIKYASNAFLATKISFINEIAQLCERLGANVDDVAKGMGMDPRIGSKFLKPGIGYGGSCFPKDTKGILWMARKTGYDFKIVKSAIEVNEQQYKIVIAKLKKHLGELEWKTIGVLGLAFKKDTDDIRESISIRIIKDLLDYKVRIRAHDPMAVKNAKRVLNKVAYFRDPYKMMNNVDAVVIATEWPEYKKINWYKVKSLMKGNLIIDGRNLLNPAEMMGYGFVYEGIGRKNMQ